MIPIRILLANYGPFRGMHSVELGPTIYSVIARDEQDQERSNWIGKSWFMSAFRYALFGKHPARLKDQMITDGEDTSTITLGLDNGVIITRTKKRGSSEQLRVTTTSVKEATQLIAQDIINKLVGFDCDDFDASCWVRQKGANDIVIADPATRTNRIAAWMDLEPLQQAYEIESKRLKDVLNREDEITRREDQIKELIETVGDAKQLAKQIEKSEKLLTAMNKDLAKTERAFEQSNKIERLLLLESQLEGVVSDGKSLKLDMQRRFNSSDFSIEKTKKAEEQLHELELKCRDANDEVRRLRKLVKGDGFDGVCPVTKGKCPVTKEITDAARKMHDECAAASNESSRITSQYNEVLKIVEESKEFEEIQRSNQSRLEALRNTAKGLIEQIEGLKADIGDINLDPVEIRTEYARLQGEIATEKAELTTNRKYLSSLDGWITELESLTKEKSSLAGKIVTHREAAHVLGRTGAQREIASAYLGEIENGANECLGGAGIDLSVTASWGRPGTELATHCHSCGQPFPRSAKIKVCEKCGAKRGPKIIEKLELEVSSDSNGAAEDIAGLAMQLSAASWLRARRQAAWSSVFIDEPFAATDTRIGQLLAGQLVRMLGGRYSFRQAFITSHSAVLTEMMPSKVLITRLKNGDRKIEVL